MKTQGYITIATGQNYLNMAKYLAMSIAINDHKRPIALLTDDQTYISETTKQLFSHVIKMPQKVGYVGCLNKLRIYDFTPFDETFFIDSDCLLVKNDMDRHWDKFNKSDFNLAGDKRTHGNWYNFQIEQAIKELNIPYIVQMNSGVIYFKKNEQSKYFFKLCKELALLKTDLLRCSHRYETQIADEPFFGAALGTLSIEPVSYQLGEGSIMVTTVNARKCVFDPVCRISSLEKACGYLLLNRFFAKKWIKHSPTIAHFVQLKPKFTYRSACQSLDKYFNSKRQP